MRIVSIAVLFLSIKNSKDESVSVVDNSVSLDDNSGTSGVSQVRFFSSNLTFGWGVIRVSVSKESCVSTVEFA